jgi:hypothetical protein
MALIKFCANLDLTAGRIEMQHSLWMVEKVLWTLSVLGSALVVWRLHSLDLHLTYRFFFLNMALSVARSLALLPFGPRTPIYYKIWVSTEPILWVSYILVVYELYSLVLKQYQGIYSLGRWFFFAAVATSSIVATLSVLTTNSTNALGSSLPLIFPYVLFERLAFTSLAIFLFLLLALIAWFPVPLSRNLLIHGTIYTGYFFVNNVLMMFFHIRGPEAASLVSDARLSTAIVCYACWILRLSQSGEDRVTSLRLGRSPVEERRMLVHLDTLNATLLRSARK